MDANKITDKVTEIREKCKGLCMMMVKMAAGEEKVVVEVTAMGETTAVELREGQVITDYVSVNSSNLYKVSSVKEQNVVITVTVFEGDPTVRVFNTYEGISKTATKKDSNHISITISPS